MCKGEARAARAFLAPSLIGIFVLVLIPTADVIRRSFFSAMGDLFVGLENYKTIFENASFQLAVHNTIRFLLVCIPLLLLFSLAAALLLYRRIRFQNLFRTTYLLPLVVPVTSVVMIIQTVFHKNGLLSALSVALRANAASACGQRSRRRGRMSWRRKLRSASVRALLGSSIQRSPCARA